MENEITEVWITQKIYIKEEKIKEFPDERHKNKTDSIETFDTHRVNVSEQVKMIPYTGFLNRLLII